VKDGGICIVFVICIHLLFQRKMQL